MQTFNLISEHTTNHAEKMRIYEYFGKGQTIALYCVKYSFRGNWYTLKEGLTRKPGKRQIERYLSTLY